MTWAGADPGGYQSFGVARLGDDGSFSTHCVSSADEAVMWLGENIRGLGIDCPLWWSSGPSAARLVDARLRQSYKNVRSGTIQEPNSLRGAVLVQGLMLALRARERWPGLRITEAHPKVLVVALNLCTRWNELDVAPEWNKACAQLGLSGPVPKTQHERDAVFAALAAREGFSGRWRQDLAASPRNTSEKDLAGLLLGPISYWWPENLMDGTGTEH